MSSILINTFVFTLTNSINSDGVTVTTEFETTPLTSTYLIGFVISDYEIVSNELTKAPQDTLHRISVRLS